MFGSLEHGAQMETHLSYLQIIKNTPKQTNQGGTIEEWKLDSIYPHLQSEELGLASQTFGEVLKESQVHGKLHNAGVNKSKGMEEITALFRPITQWLMQGVKNLGKRNIIDVVFLPW